MRRSHVAIAFVATWFGCQSLARAECGSRLPPWLSQDLAGRLLQDPSQTYFVGRGIARSEPEARALARRDAEGQVASCNFLTIRSRSSVKREVHDSTSAVEALSEVSTSSQAVASGLREVTSFGCDEAGEVSMTVVVTVPRDQLPAACGKTVDYPRPTDFLWRSALLPSWGQFHKGDSAMGYTILVTEVLAIPAAVFTGLAGRSERERAADSTVRGDRDVYNQRADTLFYTSLGVGAIAVGMYVFNLLNAYAGTPGHGVGETRIGGKSALSVGAIGSFGPSLSF